MRLLLRNSHVWLWLTLAIAFWALAYFTSLDTILLLANCFPMVVMGTVAVVYLPSAIRSIRSPSFEAGVIFYITVGIVFSYGFSFLGRLLNIIWIKSARNPIDAANDLTAFFQVGIGIGGIYLLCSPGALGRTRKRRWLSVAAIVAGSILLALALSHTRIDTTRFMEWLRHYVTL
jgi:hypothetical protein